MIRKGHTTADHVVASLAALAAAALVSSALATPPGEVEPQSRAPSAAPAPVGSEARATRQGGPLETYGFAERKPRPRYAWRPDTRLKTLGEDDSAAAGPPPPREIWADLWERLEAGASSARHPFHLGVVATAADGAPDLRTVVLRAVDAGQHQLAFHTDVRSPKVDALARASDLCWLFYDPQAKLQLRIAAQARVLTQGPYFEQRWAASRPSSRACYVHRVAPGTPLGHPLEYGPVNESGAALEAVTARGRDNFAVVLTTVRRIDWLSLSHRGHRRLRFNVTPLGFDSLWIAP